MMVHYRLIGKLLKSILKVCLPIVALLFIAECAIYPIVLYQCSWPTSEGNNVKAMFVADTHLLGPFRGHWFDKLRREWQMYQSFQNAVQIFQPEVIFFLGDLFDEGEWVDTQGFRKYVERFRNLFNVDQKIQVYVVAGNHDIGFHYQTDRVKHGRFIKAFNSSSVGLVRVRDVNFVLVNSMAMEMDGCFLCEKGIKELRVVEGAMKCQKNSSFCDKYGKLDNLSYSQPILLQHFPLFRESDANCTGEDSAPNNEKSQHFRPTIDCLSKKSSQMLLHTLHPRLILSGHTHHYCLQTHIVEGIKVEEYSVPSFSWRNRNDPSFYLGQFTSNEYKLEKCLMPKESTVYCIYEVGVLIIISLVVRNVIKRYSPNGHAYVHVHQSIFA